MQTDGLSQLERELRTLSHTEDGIKAVQKFSDALDGTQNSLKSDAPARLTRITEVVPQVLDLKGASSGGSRDGDARRGTRVQRLSSDQQVAIEELDRALRTGEGAVARRRNGGRHRDRIHQVCR